MLSTNCLVMWVLICNNYTCKFKQMTAEGSVMWRMQYSTALFCNTCKIMF